MTKNIFSIISFFLLAVLWSCSDKNDELITYDSVITPDFTFDEGEIIAGITNVQFVNKTTVEGTEVKECFWHFGFPGEGNWTEDAEPDPVVYKNPGEYEVTLTVWGEDGNKATVKKTIKVLADNVAPVAGFDYQPQLVIKGASVKFNDTSVDEDGDIVSYKWTFPDNSTSEEENPTYVFQQDGVFKVSLEVKDNRGATSSLSKAINVRAEAVKDFTVNWNKEVASSTALSVSGVVAVSDLGYIYFASGEGNIIALDTKGNIIWNYDALSKDNIYVQNEVSYPSVSSDGIVYWGAHGYGNSAAASIVYAFDGETGNIIWKNSTAYANGARIAYSTPCITQDAVIIGNRGTNGSIKGFDKYKGQCFASVAPANGGANSATVSLKNGTIVTSLSGNYGYGLLVPDDVSTWAAVPTASSLTPGSILTANRCQICVDAQNHVYIAGTAYGSSTWNIACFDCSNIDPSTSKRPLWSQTLDAGFNTNGASLSADGSTLYIITDKAEPYKLYALNASNGQIKWNYSLASQSHSVPAVDNLGNIHLCTIDGSYIVLKDNGASCAELYNKKVADAIDGSPTISSVDGNSYFIGKDVAAGKFKVYSVSFPDVTGPANSPWAQYGQNPGHGNYQK